jgi:ribonuclease H2 subunit A
MTESSNENNENNENNKNLASSVYCYCNHASSCKKCGKPTASKADTKFVIESLYSSERSPQSNVFGNGPLLLSDIPKSAHEDEVIVGIDEAGRGSSLGPMVYGMAYWSVSDHVLQKQIPKGFQDSKQLSEETRSRLFDQILQHPDIGFGMRSLLPSEISRNMLRTKPYNLNEMSHDTAMLLIRKLLDSGIKIRTCYIDTVGNPAYYKRKLEQEFPGLCEFVVESKADANYAPCSAGSVGT